MLVSIDTASAIPVYEQLRLQLQRLIAGGRLAPGARLPPIRQLAADLGVAAATVSRVYELLADDGWVVGAGRRGTVVQGQPVGAAVDAELHESLAYAVQLARQLDIPRAELIGLLDAAYASNDATQT